MGCMDSLRRMRYTPMYFRCSRVVKNLYTLAGWAWECVKFWTPLGTTVIVLWLLYRPDRFHPNVDSAVLADLNLTKATDHQPSSTIRYDLAVDLSFRMRNSHRRLSIRYLDMGASLFYFNGSTRLGPTDDALPAPFRQGPKNTTGLRPTFRGTVAVDPMVAAELERELAAGTVHVTVTLSLTLKYKVVWPFSEIFFYKYDCWLWFPPPRHAVPSIFNAGTRCWER